MKNLISIIKVDEIKSYYDLILKKIEELYKVISLYIEHNVIHTEQEHYCSTNLELKITNCFVKLHGPKQNFKFYPFHIWNREIYHI